MYHSHIHEYAKWTYNVHIYIYIYITPNIGISKHEKHITTSLFRYEIFYYLWVERFFDIRRERHNLSILAFSSAPTQYVWHPPQRSPRASESQPSSPEADLNSTNWLFKNLPESSARFRCVTLFAFSSPRFLSGLLWHLWVTRPLCAHAREHLC